MATDKKKSAQDTREANRDFFRAVSNQIREILGPNYYSETGVRERERINSELIKSMEKSPKTWAEVRINQEHIPRITLYDSALLIARERYKQGGDKNAFLETAVSIYEQAGTDSKTGKAAYKLLKEEGYRSVAAAKKHLQKAEKTGEYHSILRKK